MSEDTIIPEVSLENVRGELKQAVDKSVGTKDVYELKILIEADEVDPYMMRELRRAKMVEIDLRAIQKPLPKATDHPGQGSIFGNANPGDAPEGHKPTHFFLQLTEMPMDVKLLKKAETYLKEVTGLKLPDLRAELDGVSKERPVTLRNADGSDVFAELDAVTHRERLAEVGAIVSLVPSEPVFHEPTMDLTVAEDRQFYWLPTGYVVRVHGIDGEGIHVHSLHDHYKPVALDVFVRNVKPVPQDELQEALNDQSLFNIRSQEPRELKVPETVETMTEGAKGDGGAELSVLEGGAQAQEGVA